MSAQQSSDIVARKEIINLTLEFLETWLHQILYKCSLYPKAIFKQQKKFEVPVYIAFHSDVRDYIASFVRSCRPSLEKGDIKCISLTVLEDIGLPLEKFVLEINSVIGDVDAPIDDILESESLFALGDLEQHLRAFLIKTSLYQPKISTRDDRTFTLSIETVDGYPSSNKNHDDVAIDWIPANTDYSWKSLTPLKSANLDLFRFNTFVMEASRKGKERCP